MNSVVQGLSLAADDGQPLTAAQKRFNSLLKKVEARRQSLAAWNEMLPHYTQEHVRVILPLAQALAQAQRRWIIALDRQLDLAGWSKGERHMLTELIVTGAQTLLDGDGAADPELRALFDKHCDIDFDSAQRERRKQLQELAEAVTGLDFGDAANAATDDDMIHRFREVFGEAGRAHDASSGEPLRGSASGKQSRAKEGRREAAAALDMQSVREIFRRLASVLHPDRESDPARREIKTALMQRVNQAYAANDLFTLFELQMQCEQLNTGPLSGAGAQQLARYNRLLERQSGDLQAEIDRLVHAFCDEFGLEPAWNLSPKRALASLKDRARLLRDDVALLSRNMRMLSDRAAMKRWLKREQRDWSDRRPGNLEDLY